MEKKKKIKLNPIDKNIAKKEKYIIIFPPPSKKKKKEEVKKITDFFKNN